GALAPLIVVPLQSSIGWRPAFFVLGAAGIVWAVCWRLWYHDDPADQPGISPRELARIKSEAAPSVHSLVPWGELMRQRQLWLIGMTFVKSHAAVVVLSSLGFGIADLMLPSAWAICLDIGRNHAGVVTGAMNTAGQLGGFVCSVLFGYMVKATNNYQQPLWIV